jgi:hypothetical protein
MTRYRKFRKRRGSPWDSESSRRANKIRWAADRARRDAEEPALIQAMKEIEIENLPRRRGDALGCLQWTCFRSGRVRRWVVRIGDRADRVTIHAPDGRGTPSHGWTWVMDHLRGFLAGTKT